MKNTYKAMQIIAPSVMKMVEKDIPVPQTGEVLIKVEACGMCGADINDIENFNSINQSPRVPGHEVIGRIIAIGEHVPNIWKLGQRVGVGRLGGHCNQCPQCRAGDFQLCIDQPYIGLTRDGGYAEMLLIRNTALVSIPDDLLSEEAAPILCAGVATFNALKKSGAQAGDSVAVLGLGGLGHMAIQYARKMGLKVIALGRGIEKMKEILNLGAHIYLDSNDPYHFEELKQMRGLQAIISTINDLNKVKVYLSTLAPQGKLVLLGVGKQPLELKSSELVGGEKCVLGSITGTPYDTEKALNFSVLVEAIPQVEVIPFDLIDKAYQKLKSGEAKFRIVLNMS